MYTLSSLYRFYKDQIENNIFIDKESVSNNIIDEENKLIILLDSKDLKVSVDIYSKMILSDLELEDKLKVQSSFLRNHSFFYIPLILDVLLEGIIFLRNGGDINNEYTIISKSL